MASATDIVGYIFQAEQYTPEGVIAALPTGAEQKFDGWALAANVNMSVEDNLNELAAAFGIDRLNESTFDSWDFPKVIFRDSVEEDDRFRDQDGEYVLAADI